MNEPKKSGRILGPDPVVKNALGGLVKGAVRAGIVFLVMIVLMLLILVLVDGETDSVPPFLEGVVEGLRAWMS